MTTRVVWTLAVLMLGCDVSTARAQDDRRFGLTMGFPASVGVLWHVTDRLAIRPDIDVSRMTIRTERSSTLFPVPEEEESTARSVRPGISALIYLARREELRLYISPRYSYVSAETSQLDAEPSPESSTHVVSGSFGAEHRLGSRFAVFGELGIEYTRSRFRLSDPPILSSTTRRTGIESRSGVGVVLYS